VIDHAELILSIDLAIGMEGEQSWPQDRSPEQPGPQASPGAAVAGTGGGPVKWPESEGTEMAKDTRNQPDDEPTGTGGFKEGDPISDWRVINPCRGMVETGLRSCEDEEG
jgi:hypothetical protein